MDVDRLVADDLQAQIVGQLRAQSLHRCLAAVDDGDRVLARLAADVELHAGHAVEARGRARLLRAVLGAADVGDAHADALARLDHQIVEAARVVDASHRAQHQLAVGGADVAARRVAVLTHQGLAHLGDGQVVGGESIGVEPDVDGAFAAAVDADLADAVLPFETPLDALVGELRELAQAPVPGQGQGQDRGAVVVELRHDGRLDVARQPAGGDGHAVAHVLRGEVDVARQVERADHERTAGARDRTQLGDAGDGVQGLLDRLRHGDLDLFGRGAGQRRANRHRGQVDRGVTIDRQPREADRADDHHRQHEHAGEDRAVDADLGELLHVSCPRRGPGSRGSDRRAHGSRPVPRRCLRALRRGSPGDAPASRDARPPCRPRP